MLADVDGHHVHFLEQRSNTAALRLVRLDDVVVAEVHPRQELEGLVVAVGHLDLLVHPPRPDQRRVQLADVVGGEHDEPLLAARRPDAVDEVEQAGQGHLAALGGVLLLLLFRRRSSVVAVAVAVLPSLLLLLALALAGQVERAVDVLEHHDGLALGLDEQLPEVGVGLHRRELEVVDVVLEVVRHGGDHGGLAGARRTVQEIPALPRLAHASVVVLALLEHVEVVDDLLLLRWVHGQLVERLGVLERDMRPNVLVVTAVIIYMNQQFSCAFPNVLRKKGA